MRMVVVLPLPLGPRKPKIWPRSTWMRDMVDHGARRRSAWSGRCTSIDRRRGHGASRTSTGWPGWSAMPSRRPGLDHEHQLARGCRAVDHRRRELGLGRDEARRCRSCRPGSRRSADRPSGRRGRAPSSGSGTKKRTLTLPGGSRLTTMPPASTHSPAVANAVIDHGRHRRAHGPLLELPARLRELRLAHRHLGRSGRDLVVARRQPGGGEIGLHGRDPRPALGFRRARLIEAGLRRRSRGGRAGPAARDPARHRSASPSPRRDWPPVGRSPPAACRASGRQAGTGPGQLAPLPRPPRPAAGHPPAEQQRAGLHLVAPLQRHLDQPAGGGSAQPHILALGIAAGASPARRRRSRRAAGCREGANRPDHERQSAQQRFDMGLDHARRIERLGLVRARIPSARSRATGPAL